MERGTEGHGVDNEKAIREIQKDDLQQVGLLIWTDAQDLRRVGLELEVNDGDRVVDGVVDCR